MYKCIKFNFTNSGSNRSKKTFSGVFIKCETSGLYQRQHIRINKIKKVDKFLNS